MIERQATTTITDALGEEHPYTLVLFGAERGVSLGLRIAKIVGGPLASFLQSVDLAEGESVLDVDVGGLSAALGDLPQRILDAGGFAFIRELLSTCKRGTRDPGSGRVVWEDLSQAHAIDGAYAGNYGELLAAIAWVVTENYAPFSTDGTRSWRGALGSLSGLLGGPVTASAPSATESTPRSASADS